MKQMTCKTCGSTDLAKEGEIYVCQSCGCQYSAEEAQKIMIEGVVDISGSTVRIDVSDKIKNLYLLARRAREEGKYNEVVKYYDQIIVEEPNSWEAVFYGEIAKIRFMNIRYNGIRNVAIMLGNCVTKVVKLVEDYVEKYDEKITAFSAIKSETIDIVAGLVQLSINHYNEKVITEDIMKSSCEESCNVLYTFGNLTEKIICKEGNKKNNYNIFLSAWIEGINLHKKVFDERGFYAIEDTDNQNTINYYVSKILEYKKDYQPPSFSNANNFIWTAIFLIIIGLSIYFFWDQILPFIVGTVVVIMILGKIFG